MRCRHCGEVIGVYEPLVVQTGEASRQGSLAAEPELARATEAALYHRKCHAARDGHNAVPE